MIEQAARAALTTHDHLREVDAAEPKCDTDGMPLNRGEWLRWHGERHLPAYADWKAAMQGLADALGHSVSSHPYNFRPICETIIAEARS